MRIAVVGAGTMGAQIAALAVNAGYAVSLHDSDPEALGRAERRIEESVMPAIAAARASKGLPGGPPGSLVRAASLEAAVAEAGLVIEAIREKLEDKLAFFPVLSRLAPDAILATNSSSIPSSALAGAVARPERLVNMHFFAPVWVRTILEVMGCGRTDGETLAEAARFGRSLGLVTAIVRVESRGFIMNRVWRAVKRESLRVVDEGVATPEEVDSMFRLFFETRHAPFAMMDMIGLDTIRDVEWSYQRDSPDPTDRPSPTLRRLIEEGRLGEKTGRGFYEHPEPGRAT